MADDDPKKPFDAVFYLKGGAWFSVRLDELSTQRSQLSGELTRVSWTSADPTVALQTIDISQIAAIVTRDVDDRPLAGEVHSG